MGYKWTSLCKCISFSHRKKASFWRLENSFPTPTHQFDLFLLLKCQLFHLVSFFSYVADWNPSLVKSHHLSQLCQSFTRGGNFLMWLQTLSLSTQTVVFQESNETIWSKDKTFIFSTQKKSKKDAYNILSMPASLFFKEMRQQAHHLGFPSDNTPKELTASCLESPNDFWCDLTCMNYHQREHWKLFPDNEERIAFIYTPWIRSANPHGVMLDKEQSPFVSPATYLCSWLPGHKLLVFSSINQPVTN